MADESEKVEIEVTDKVDPNAAKKLREAAAAARDAETSVTKLQKAYDAHQLASQKLATEVQKTNVAYLNSEAALNKAIAAEVRASTETTRLATAQVAATTGAQRLATEQQRTAVATQQLATAQNQTIVSTQKIATEQQKTNTAYLNSEAALNRAVASEVRANSETVKLTIATQQLSTAQQQTLSATQRLSTEQQKTAAAAQTVSLNQQKVANAFASGALTMQRYTTETQRSAAAQNQAATAAQKLSTETNRTAKEAANAQAATDRAALASLRLAGAQNQAGGATSATAEALRRWVVQLVAVDTVIRLGKAVANLSDDYTNLQNKLKIVTETEAQQVELTARIFQLANETRTPVAETAASFARLDNSLVLLGKSQNQTLRLQKTLNELFTIGGATTSEQANALLQLSQAFNSGRLQGDEFRSLMENMPRQVRTALAAALGENEANLKKLSSQGKITADVLFKAFSSLDQFADSKFAKTVPTIAASMVILKNALTEVVGEFNNATGASSKVGTVFSFISDKIRETGKAYVILVTQLDTAYNFVISASKQLGSEIKNFFIDTYNSIIEFAEKSVNSVIAAFNKVRETVGLSTFQLVNFDRISKDGETKFKTMGELWGEALSKSMQETGFDNIAAGLDSKGHSSLRGTGPDLTGVDSFTAKDVASLERAIANIDISLSKATRSDLERDGNKIQTENTSELKKVNSQNAKLSDRLNELQKAETAIFNATTGKRDQFSTNATAISRLSRNGEITSADKLSATNDLAKSAGIDTSGTTIDTQVRLDGYKTMYAQIDEMRKKDLLKEKEAVELRGKVAQAEMATRLETTHKVLDGVSALMQSGNQRLFNIGKAAAIANATVNMFEGISVALKTSPWYVGVALGIEAAAEFGSVISNLKKAQPAGFMMGGYTGDGPSDQIAGTVHGKEWVMNAQATSRIGRDNLSALQSGAATVSRNAQQTTQAPKLTFINMGTPQKYEVKQISPTEIRAIARDEVNSQAPKVIASEISNPNSKVSKSLSGSTSTVRKR